MIPNKCRAVIFDLDGLLIDTTPVWDQADALLLKKRNIQYSSQISAMTLGLGQKEVAQNFREQYGFTESINTIIEQRRSLLYELLGENIAFMPGGREVIEYFKSREFSLAIATCGHSLAMIKKLLTRLNVDAYFSVFASGDGMTYNKPHPEIYLETAKLLDQKPEHCLAFEDSPNGVKAASSAGMRVYAVNADLETHPKLRKSGAHKIFASFTQFLTTV